MTKNPYKKGDRVWFGMPDAPKRGTVVKVVQARKGNDKDHPSLRNEILSPYVYVRPDVAPTEHWKVYLNHLHHLGVLDLIAEAACD